MSTEAPDPFASRTREDVFRARTANLTLGELGSILTRVAHVVMTMPDSDTRYPYATKYLGYMFAYSDEAAQVQIEEPDLGDLYAGFVQLGSTSMYAYDRMLGDFGEEGADPLSRPSFRPEHTRSVHEAISAVDAVLTGLIIGRPTDAA